MSKLISVSGLYDLCARMLRDNWGYIYGTAGVLCTAQTIRDSAERFPDNAEITNLYGRKWIGHWVADCSGVMVYIWRQYGLTIPHGSNSIKRQSVGALQKDPAPGFAAFKVRNDSDYYHVGIVAEDGQTVYEAKSTQRGFTTSPASSWHWFAPFKQVDYSGGVEMPAGEPLYEAKVTTKSGSLNLRSGPSTSYPIICKLERGSTVEVLTEYETGWDFIRQKQLTGYAAAAYLTPVNSSASTEADQYTSSPNGLDINGSETPAETPKDEDEEIPAEDEQKQDDMPSQTILRHKGNNVTIALMGEWELVGKVEGD